MSEPWKDKLKTAVSSYENVSELVFDQSVDEGVPVLRSDSGY